MDTAVILRRFDQPDETRQLILGRFDIVRIGGMTIGRATYQPGWRWSEHVGRALGQERCNVEHLGLVVSGIATAAFADGASSNCARESCSTFRPSLTTVG
jgi:hypothetical protein